MSSHQALLEFHTRLQEVFYANSDIARVVDHQTHAYRTQSESSLYPYLTIVLIVSALKIASPRRKPGVKGLEKNQPASSGRKTSYYEDSYARLRRAKSYIPIDPQLTLGAIFIHFCLAAARP